MVRNSADRTWTVAWIGFSTFLVAAPLLPFVHFPTHGFGFAAVSAVLHVLYLGLLAKAYKLHTLSTAYPIARGSSPALVAIGGLVFAHERLSVLGAAGCGCVVVGILLLGLGEHGISKSGVGLAVSIGGIIALYTVIDALGVRASGRSIDYNVWSYAIYGALTTAFFTVRRGANWFKGEPKRVAAATMGGLVSMIAYAIVTFAMRSSSMGYVSALRETSVVIAAFLGWCILREKFTAQKGVATVLVTIGAGLIGLAR